MNKDFRLSVTLPTHPKTIKLMRKAGDRAFYNLIRLWTFATQNRPDGNLKNMDVDDIEIAADWQGDEGAFVGYLVELRFIDQTDGGYIIHDWVEHNEYASHAEDRSKKAKKAARVRWEKEAERQADKAFQEDSKTTENDNINAKACPEHMLNDANRNAKSCSELCPSPSPSPIPSPSPKEDTSCPELPDSSSPKKEEPVLKILLINRDGEFEVFQKDVDEWQDTFPGVNVLPALKAIRQWNKDNPKNRKTSGGIRKHITGWLSREQNKAVREGKPMAQSVDKDKILKGFRKKSKQELKLLSEAGNIYAFEILRERGEAIQPKTKTMEAR
ncbi:hypothetical protein [Desulfobacula sp.]|uniref:hypothetical protein n=1 Tax=Desulfobacula sp. TaxID=2593537 RepID=UPI002620D5C9|nr:hypothetical protein [Desulfobacula sp.]